MLSGAKGPGGARGSGGTAVVAGGHSHPVSSKTPGKPTVRGPGDSFESGPGKAVTAYVNGRPRTIKVVPVGNGQYMRADAAKSFGEMTSAARRAGINLGATSVSVRPTAP